MPALVDLVEVDEVAIGAPGPGLRGSVDLAGKHRDGDRERDLGGLLRGRSARTALSAVLPVEPRCRGCAVRQPVQRDRRRAPRPGTFRDRRCCTSTARSLDARASTPRGRPESPSGRSRSSAAGCPSSWRRTGLPFWRTRLSASNVARSLSESPAGADAVAASAWRSRAARVAGKLRWMPSKPAGAWRAIALEMGEPQSPPWAT